MLLLFTVHLPSLGEAPAVAFQNIPTCFIISFVEANPDIGTSSSLQSGLHRGDFWCETSLAASSLPTQAQVVAGILLSDTWRRLTKYPRASKASASPLM